MMTKIGKFWIKIEEPFLLLVAVCGTWFIARLLNSLYHDPIGQSLALWVQAIGSMAAILTSFWIFRRQSKQTIDAIDHAKKQEKREKLGCILATASAANDFAKITGEAIEKDPGIGLRFTFQDAIIEGLVDALNAIQIHELGTSSGAMALISLRNEAVLLQQYVQIYIDGPNKLPGFPEMIESCKSDPGFLQRVPELRREQTKLLIKNVQDRVENISKHYGEFKNSIETICDNP